MQSSEHLTSHHKKQTYRVRAHGPEMRRQRQESQAVEQRAIHKAVGQVLRRNEHDEQDDEFGKEDEKPGDDRAHDAAGIFDEPHFVRPLMTGWKTLSGLQAVGLPLDVPEARYWSSHPTTEIPFCWKIKVIKQNHHSSSNGCNGYNGNWGFNDDYKGIFWFTG